MILSYGSYSFDDNEVSFEWDKQLVLGKTGRATHYQYQCRVTGVKQATTVASLTSKLTSLESAMESSGQDLVFKDNDSNNTVHVATSSSTINGVRAIGGVKYPKGNPGSWGSGSEYTVYRTYQVVFQWEIAANESNLVVYQESIRISGGGPRFVIQETLTGSPVQQQTAQQSKVIAIQQGIAIGYSSYPSFPAFRYSTGYLREELSYQESETPLNFAANTNTNFPIRWKYHYESPIAIGLLTPALPSF